MLFIAKVSIKSILIKEVYLPIIYIVGALIIYAILSNIVDRALIIRKISPKNHNYKIKEKRQLLI